MSSSVVLVLVLLWPLLLAGAFAFATTRRYASPLAATAALPALAVALGMEEATLSLSEAMLGGVLQLDAQVRGFLVLAAVLSLVAGLLARGRTTDSGDSTRTILLMLLAITGVLAAVLAGDALLFFSAATLFGYSLYAMHAAGSGVAASAGRIFVVLLVVSDLAVFELLLVLAQDAGGTGFAALRHSLLLADYPAEVFLLLLLGFGIKLGLIGFHLWLAPVFVTAAAPVRPLLLGFVICVGMLGWMRLLPLGEVHWPDTGRLLQWLSWVGLVYAAVVGVLQRHIRSLLAYGVMAQGALFLWLLGAVLAQPTLWTVLFDVLPDAMMQGGLALAVLLLLPGRFNGLDEARLHGWITVAGWVAALLLVAAPLEIIANLAMSDPVLAITFSWPAAIITLLTTRALRLKRTAPATPVNLLAVAVLTLAGLLSTFSPVVALLPAVAWAAPWQAVLLMVFAAFTGWYAGEPLLKHLPPIPPGDLLYPITRGVLGARRAMGGLTHIHLPHWRAGMRRAFHRLLLLIAWRNVAGRAETLLGRWRTAMVMLVLLLVGMLLALLGRIG